MKQWIIVENNFDPEEHYYDDEEDEEFSGYSIDYISYDYWFNVKIGKESKFLKDGTYQTTEELYYEGAKECEIYDEDELCLREMTDKDMKRLKNGELKIVCLHS